MKLEKGGLIMDAGIWYVIVEVILNKDKELKFNCICDHANNIHDLSLDEVDHVFDLRAILDVSYGNASEELRACVEDRSIPYEQIFEVLAGDHDGKFDHWGKV